MIKNQPQDDQQLIISIREGGIKALAALHKRFYKILLYHAKAILLNREDGEDVVNELFFSLLKRKEDINITRDVKAYLVRAVKNRCITFIGSANREKEILKGYRQTITEYVPATSRMEDAETYRELLKAINSLPPQMKMAIELCYLQEMKKKEVARIMKISPQSVTKYASEGLKRLAKFNSLKML
ncbi:RNA polymerase sigma factor [Chitinophaga ginsengisoli]|uniref:RNA polymerase sigma-70 factor (ECF subfamily) n=1 Tax=Chitinophaga ginsengisoli TaxID=363837 RepID=A0A2P8GHV6_9BACT|nr:sigma-70 family RNA polymerase sigma factor [Chitinophaga ginsengisoli]PSL33559.1 RNA polymerase sigma-70 factor (ECF subfamily) [Chitinophaga ginsengisoli]